MALSEVITSIFSQAECYNFC